MDQKSFFGAAARYLPILEWGPKYTKDVLTNDLLAAMIVTIMLVPQSLAYALLAGLPAEMGIYASIVPIVLYAIFGTSRALAVGPVAVVSLMTATAVGKVATLGSIDYVTAALTLAFLSGLILLALGLLRLGFLTNFLSHPVIAGFITASGILIAMSQVKHLLGIKISGDTVPELVEQIIIHLGQTNVYTLALGVAGMGFLFWVRNGLKPVLRKLGMRARPADLLAKIGPVLAILLSTLVTWGFDFVGKGVQVVGEVPQSLPPLTTPSFSFDLIGSLLGSALLISIIGFVESISVAQTLAAKKRQRIDPNQELIGLGAANIGAAFTGGYPVTGGFSRSVVNYDAGAATPAAGAYTAVGLGFAALFLTPLIYFLPKAILAATIIVAVLSLIDFSILRKSWLFSKPDFAAVSVTIFLTLVVGVEAGISAGVLLSIVMYLYKTSRPHIAEVGQIAGTEHFRNVKRYDVITYPHISTLRVDESLYFANARFLEDYIYDLVASDSKLRHVVLLCSAVNVIDMSALESLEAINERLKSTGVKFHLSEIKGPVMDRLAKTLLIADLSGQVFLSQHQAIETLKD
jgi:SulP family sulfate permease